MSIMYCFLFKIKRFIYFWLRWVLIAVCGFSLVAVSRALIAVCGFSLVMVSRGYSVAVLGLLIAWLLLSTGPRYSDFSSCGTWA